MSAAVRLTISLSSETNFALRSLLGTQGMKKGDLSAFIEKAVCREILDKTVQEVKERNRDLSSDDLDAEIDQAIRETRAQMRNSV